MNKVVKKKWLKALKSGKYTKGRHALKRTMCTWDTSSKTEDQYCCLGVLCEIAIKDGIIDKYNGDTAYTPSKVFRWAELKGRHTEQYRGRMSHQANLAYLNDTSNSFDNVIEYIEKSL